MALIRTALVLLLSATSTLISLSLAGCGEEKPQVAVTQIPGPPSYLKPIYAPKMKVGDDIRIHNNKRGRVIKMLNSIVKKTEAAWLKLQEDLANPQGSN